MMTEAATTIASELRLASGQVAAAIGLFDDGNTIPFVARYRKEATGGLDEEQLRHIEARLSYLRHLAERKSAVLKSIEEQGRLTADLAAAVGAATTLQAVEDLYLPYKPKRRTRASVAKERGLEPLADLLWEQSDRRLPEALATYNGAIEGFHKRFPGATHPPSGLIRNRSRVLNAPSRRLRARHEIGIVVS
jgi:uncharacterized protein